MEEIRKLKSVIVKQENRIRALEATVKGQVAAATPVPADHNHDDNMAPDEVWTQAH